MRNLLWLLMLSPSLWCQTAAPPKPGYPVSARFVEGAAAGGGGGFSVRVEIKMEGEYHIYGFEEESGLPTSVSVGGAGRVELAGPVAADREPGLHSDPLTGTVSYWEGSVVFEVPLRLLDPVPGERVEFSILIEHMACTDRTCLVPEVLKLPLAVLAGDDGAIAAVSFAGDGGGGGGEDPEEDEPGEIPEEVLVKEVAATLSPARPRPKGEVVLRIPFPAYSVEPGAAVAAASVYFFRPGLELLEGADVVIEGTDEEPVAAIRCVAGADLHDEEELRVEGLAVIAGYSVNFAVEARIRQSLWGFIWIAILAALAALLTPCVFPMIPITVSFFTKHAEKSSGRPVGAALIYCIGIVLSFTLIGLVLSLAFQTNAAAISQSPVVLGAIGLLFIVFAMSLFGMFELQLPAALTNLVGTAQGKGGLLGIWLLGLLFAITSFACTAPFVGGLLAASISSSQWLRPMVGMAVFSAVLAVPFFFLALFPSRLKNLPKAGGWMNEVKVVMGFVELAAGLKFLGDMDFILHLGFFTRSMILSSWIAIFVLIGFYLLGTFRLPHDAPRTTTPVPALILAVLSLTFAAYLGRGVTGGPLNGFLDSLIPAEEVLRTPIGQRDALIREIRNLGAGVGLPGGGLPDGRVGYEEGQRFKNEYEEARAEARRLGVPLFIDFTGYS